MTNEPKITYPKIPVGHWWSLRKKFQQSMPPKVTPAYLVQALGGKEESARANILPGLVALKIVDEEQRPTDRARRWRMDSDYPSVCEEMRNEIYPQSLLAEIPPSSADHAKALEWFMRATGVGRGAADQMARVYVLLCEADPARGDKPSVKTVQKATAVTQPKAKSVPVAETLTKLPAASEIARAPERQPEPSLHIDIQIHLSPDATADQIDQVFASLARHLRGDLGNE